MKKKPYFKIDAKIKNQNVIKNAKCGYRPFLFLHCILIFAICVLNVPIKKIYAIENSVVVTKIAAFEQSGYEWIEIANRSNQPVDTAGWKFWEGGANHGWNLAQGDDLVLNSGERAVIVQDKDKFLEKNPDFKDAIIDSAWSSLKESGEEIGLKDANLELVEVFSYIECSEGILERIDLNLNDYTENNWKEIKEEKDGEEGKDGREREEETGDQKSKTEETGDAGLNSDNGLAIYNDLLQSSEKLFVNHPPAAVMGEDMEINAGEAVFFDGSDSFDEDGDALEYFWDFGDGGEGEGAQIEHKYEHQGKFSAILRVSDGKLTASDAIWVNVFKINYSASIFINSFLPNPAGPDTYDEWIEVCNSGSEPANLSEWILDDIAEGGSKEYIIKNIEIGADGDECIKFYRKETKISLNNNGDSVRILNPAGEVADEVIYNKNVKDEEAIYSQKSVKSVKSKVENSLKTAETEKQREKEIGIEMEDSFSFSSFSTGEEKNDKPANQLMNKQISLPLAIRTVDIYGGTLEGELVKVAGKITDKSGNVFFIDDGSGAARIWLDPKSKIDYILLQVGNEIIVSGFVSKTAFGCKIIAGNLEK